MKGQPDGPAGRGSLCVGSDLIPGYRIRRRSVDDRAMETAKSAVNSRRALDSGDADVDGRSLRPTAENAAGSEASDVLVDAPATVDSPEGGRMAFSETCRTCDRASVTLVTLGVGEMNAETWCRARP